MEKTIVLKLRAPIALQNGISFRKDEEFVLVQDVVYINGNMLDIRFQHFVFDWIKANPALFTNETRTW